MTNSSW